MKKITAILLVLIGSACSAQHSEFDKSSNGLIYSETTIKQLKFIVDSLNLKFKVCELNKIYLSKFQAKAHFVSLEKRKIKEAKNDMDANISFDDFINKYPTAVLDKELLVVKFNYKNYEEKDILEFSSVELGNKYGHELNFKKNLSNYNQSLAGK